MSNFDSYKRGSYRQKASWTKDNTPTYFHGFHNRVVCPLVKAFGLALVIGICYVLLGMSAGLTGMICILSILYYPYLVQIASTGRFMVIPIMDQACLVMSSELASLNGIQIYGYDKELDRSLLEKSFRKACKLFPKLKYKLVEVCGDYYYEEMGEDEAISKCIVKEEESNPPLKNKEEICRYLQDNMNEKMPTDGPLLRMYVQGYSEGGKEKSILITKAHHSLMDGISAISLTLAVSEDYDTSYFIKSRSISTLEQILFRLLLPF